MFSEVLYYSLLASFFTHELDAVKRHEWRVLPILRSFPEKIGEQLFIWLHIPLFLAIFWFDEKDNTLRLFVSGFAIVHVGLHWLFRNHPAYEFNNTSSWILIILTGVLGLAYLISYNF